MSIERTTWYDRHSIWAVVGLTFADRLITVPNFSYESNPIVAHLGAFNWIVLTVGLMALLLGVWYFFGMYRSKIAVSCVGLLSGLMAFVVATNVWVVYG